MESQTQENEKQPDIDETQPQTDPIDSQPEPNESQKQTEKIESQPQADPIDPQPEPIESQKQTDKIESQPQTHSQNDKIETTQIDEIEKTQYETPQTYPHPDPIEPDESLKQTDEIESQPQTHSQNALLDPDTQNDQTQNDKKEKYSASGKFAEEIINLIGHNDLSMILDLQDEIHDNLRQSVEAMSSMNDLASKEYAKLLKEYQKHTKMLKEMKNDLNYIAQRIRDMKIKLKESYPSL